MGMTETTKDGRLVRLARVGTEPLAEMWAEVLRHEGINCLLKSEGPGAGALATGALLEYSIWVLESEADRARETLAAFWESDGSADGDTDPWAP